MRTTVRRHFAYIVKEINPEMKVEQSKPELFVLKEKSTHSRAERFSCRLKSNILATYQGKVYLIIFMHSLKIDVSESPLVTKS